MEQDWNEVTWTKKAPTTVKEANARGIEIKTDRKMGAVNTGNYKGSQDGQKLAKVARTEVGSHEKVSREMATAIIKGRTEKKLSQKAFAQMINEKVDVVTGYEAMRSMPNIQVINKMEKHLGIHLVGKNIGTIKDSKFKNN